MQETEAQNKNFTPGVWILIMACVAVVIFTLACGAAYAGIQSARQTAARASLGQIESVLILAEKSAESSGFTPPDGSFSAMLKSYDDTDSTNLTDYEKFVRETMLDRFGPKRDFDFAINRFEDGGGVHTYIYYFPLRGYTDLKSDKYYLQAGAVFTEHTN